MNNFLSVYSLLKKQKSYKYVIMFDNFLKLSEKFFTLQKQYDCRYFFLSKKNFIVFSKFKGFSLNKLYFSNHVLLFKNFDNVLRFIKEIADIYNLKTFISFFDTSLKFGLKKKFFYFFLSYKNIIFFFYFFFTFLIKNVRNNFTVFLLLNEYNKSKDKK